MTRDELLVRAKQLLNKAVTTAADDSGRPTNAELVQAIEESRQEIYSELFDWLPTRQAATTTLSYTADTEAVALPSAAQNTQLVRVYYSASTVYSMQSTLDPIAVEEFALIPETGSPRYYAVTGTYIRLRPVPGSTTTLTIVYLPKLSALASGSASPTEIDSQWHHVYAYKAAIKIRQKNEDPYDGLQKAYTEIYDKLVMSVERRANDNHIKSLDNNFWGS